MIFFSFQFFPKNRLGYSVNHKNKKVWPKDIIISSNQSINKVFYTSLCNTII